MPIECFKALFASGGLGRDLQILIIFGATIRIELLMINAPVVEVEYGTVTDVLGSCAKVNEVLMAGDRSSEEGYEKENGEGVHLERQRDAC